MTAFLGVIAVLSYLFAGFGLLIVFGGHGTDIQFILSGVCATCGTVAAAGSGIIAKLDSLQAMLPKPATATAGQMSAEERAGM